LREGISNDFDLLFKAFSNSLNGQFRNPIQSLHNKRVMQLCLALAYSEPIRNFKAIKWNEMLLSTRYYFKSVVQLVEVRKAFEYHPMARGGTFQKRKTGHSGHTRVAENNVQRFEEFVNKCKESNKMC